MVKTPKKRRSSSKRRSFNKRKGISNSLVPGEASDENPFTQDYPDSDQAPEGQEAPSNQADPPAAEQEPGAEGSTEQAAPNPDAPSDQSDPSNDTNTTSSEQGEETMEDRDPAAQAPDQETPVVDPATEIKTVKMPALKAKEFYPENLLAGTEGGYSDFIPAWAFPKVQIRAVVNMKDRDFDEWQKKDWAEYGKDQIPIKDTIDALSRNVVKAVLSQFEHLTISKIYHYAQLGEFTTILFREKKLVDVLVHVLDKTFHAHKHVLCCHSEFFSILLMAHSKPPDVITDVTLSNINPNYFQDFLHFIYYGEIELNEQNIPPLLNLCNKLNASMMRARIHMFIAAHGDLHPNLVKKILTTRMKADRPLAILKAIEKFDELRDDIQFLGRLDFDDLVEILSSDDLNIKSELDVFWAAIIWVADDVRDRFHYLDMLMNTVRVTCMSTLELMDISRATSLIRWSKRCQQIIMNATWVCHAREMGLQDPLSLPIQTPRKHLIGKPPYQPNRAEFDRRYRQYKKSIGDDQADEFVKTLEALAPGKQRGRVVFADEKGTDLEYVYVAEQRIDDSKKKSKVKKKGKKKKKKEKKRTDRSSESRKKEKRREKKSRKASKSESSDDVLDLWQGENPDTGDDVLKPESLMEDLESSMEDDD